MPHTWDPDRYLTYADERGRPFVELVARIGATAPTEVVDLGCGARQPHRAARRALARRPRGRARLESGDDRRRAGTRPGRRLTPSPTCATGEPERPVDVLVTNATLQWVPGHLELLPSLVAAVAPGGWFAFQVPGNFDEPSHTIRAELAAEAPYAEHTAGVAMPSSHDPAVYYDALTAAGCSVDVWETTYTHVLARCRPGLHLGLRHRRPADPAGAAGRPAAELRGGVQAPAGRGLPGPRRRHACCCRSAGSSRWPGSPREAPPRPGLLPARRRGGRAPLLRRGARDDRGREAGRARRAGRRLVPGVRRRGRGHGGAARRCRGAVRAGPQGAPGVPAAVTRGAGGGRGAAGASWGTTSTAASGTRSRGTAGCT